MEESWRWGRGGVGSSYRSVFSFPFQFLAHLFFLRISKNWPFELFTPPPPEGVHQLAPLCISRWPVPVPPSMPTVLLWGQGPRRPWSHARANFKWGGYTFKIWDGCCAVMPISNGGCLDILFTSIGQAYPSYQTSLSFMIVLEITLGFPHLIFIRGDLLFSTWRISGIWGNSNDTANRDLYGWRHLVRGSEMWTPLWLHTRSLVLLML